MFRSTGKKFSAVCGNCVLLVHRNILRRNRFSFKSMKFFHFQTMWKSSVFSCRNRKTCILREKLKKNFLCFTRPLVIIEEKYISQLIIFRQFRKMKKTFGLLPKNYREICQNCILRVQRNIMWIIFLFFDKSHFSQIFSTLERAKKFSTFWPKLLVVFKNWILPVHKDFCKKSFFWKKLMKFYLFWTLKEKSAYCRFFWLFFQLCILCDPTDCLGNFAVFGEKVVLEITSTLTETFLALWHIFFLAWLSKVHSTGSWECFEEI